ncbi:MAG: HAMP domain-containing histidine kinase [Clostridia bacterium]|nr:HAMP domain-containing histidine kinase [Clostridia bacterium]
MFKSVFAKYVTAVMAIFAIGFALLLAIVTSIVNDYVAGTKDREMSSTVTALRDCVDATVASVSPENFSSEMCAAFRDPDTPLSVLFRSLSANDGDLTLSVADRQGKVIYMIGTGAESGALLPDLTVSREIVDTTKSGKEFYRSLKSSLSKRAIPTRAEGVFNASGEYCGMVIVGITQLSWGSMMLEMTETILSTALLVLVAAMIAVYCISARVISPLREMSVAAERFAKGKFDTRVRVRGDDEVARLAIAFNHIAESLENLEKMRSTFVANVSHDLRTPMTTIAGFIGEIRDGVIPPEKQDHYLGVIETEVKRLSRLVATLLDLSRIQAGERKFAMRPFDICEMGRQILISFEQQIEEKHLEVEFETDADRMNVYADYDAIYQVLYNLCHNAVKFSREGGLLRVRMNEIKEHKIQVSVYNEGKGIAEEDLPFVFERFYKSDKSRGLDKSGLGLGLYISKTIMDAHGETIRAESRSGENCEFFFTLRKTAMEPERRKGETE